MSSRRLTCLLGALSFADLISAGAIPIANPFHGDMDRTPTITERNDDPWPYAVVGDSWGSGFAWKDEFLYDNNTDFCLRTTEAHGPQMEKDNQWSGFQKSTLRDAACSGSTLGDIVKGQNQIGKVGHPNVLVMTSGGNQAFFGNIVEDCIYHPHPFQNYGPAYKDDKDGTGYCFKSLNTSLNYIKNPKGMEFDLRATIDDIFADPAVKDNSEFLLYITGYAQFFGTDLDDWCNNEIWNIPGISPAPYLSKELRQTFNDNVDRVNKLYQNVTGSAQYLKQVRYIDLDSKFSGHRFCEPGQTSYDQRNTDTQFESVYFWNLNYFTGQGVSDAAVQYGSTSLSPQEVQSVWGNGEGVTAWSGSGGDGNKVANGWRMRPFHPRFSGYTRIKDAIYAQLQVDGLPPQPTAPQPTGLPPQQTASQQTAPQQTAPAIPAEHPNTCCVTSPRPGYL